MNCNFCNNDFIPFRKDQQYCSISCRVSNNNNKAKQIWRRVNERNLLLRNNYLILEKVLGDENEIVIQTQILDNKSYLYNHLTHFEKKGNEIIYWVYNISLKHIVDNKFLIKRK